MYDLRLILDLVNSINNIHLRVYCLTFVLCRGIFSLKCVLIEYTMPNLSLICIYISEISKNPRFKTVFEHNITFRICFCVYVTHSQRLFCSKNCIKALSGLHLILNF